MLRRITLRNFVNFRDTQTLEFGKTGERGVFTFVGANGSGKSTVFEAIRRCTELQFNENISKRNLNSESLVMCLFVKEEQAQNLVSYYMVWEHDGHEGTADEDSSHSTVKRARLLSIDNDTKDTTECVAVRVLILDKQDKTGQKESSFVWSKWNKDVLDPPGWKCYDKQLLNEDEKATLFKYGDTQEKDMNEYLNEVANVLKTAYKRQSNDGANQSKEEHAFDEMFQRFTRTEFLFGHRGISPIQTSDQLKTMKDQEDQKDQKNRYKKATKNAYIITQFLEADGNQGTTANQDTEINRADPYDRKVEEIIFRTITARGDYIFEQKEGKVFVRSGNEQSPLLKVSEGIVEAKYISILLSNHETSTLILEEPGRGMHKDYIDVLVNRVFCNEELTGRKTVILSTHNRDFLTPSTLSNTFFFMTDGDGGNRIKRLRSVPKKRTCQFITRDAVSALFFSARTICVEGESDQIFVNTMKEIMLRNKYTVPYLNEETVDKQNMFQNFLATLGIITLDGEKNRHKIEDICKELDDKPERRLYLLDLDTKADIEKDNSGTPNTDFDTLEEGTFIWNELTNTQQQCKVRHDSSGDEVRRSNKSGTNTETRQEIPEDLEKHAPIHEPTPDTSKDPKIRDRDSKSKQVIKEGTLEYVVNCLSEQHDRENHRTPNESCSIEGCKGMGELKSIKSIRKDDNKKKFLLGDDVTTEDIENDVKRILEVSVKYKKGEIWRFLEFIKERSFFQR